MSYINGNNIYGVRTVNDKSSKYYNSQNSKYEINPQVMNENEMMPVKGFDQEVAQQSNCSYHQPQNPCPPPSDCKENHGNQHNDCEDHHHNHQDDCKKKECKKDEWDCGGKTDNCCNGQTCKFDPSKVKCVCTYMDLIFGESKAPGSTLFATIDTTTTADFVITNEYKPTDHCCNPCVIDATSSFTIDSTKVNLKRFAYTGTTITSGDILVNGSPVISVVTTPNGLIATVNPSILDEDCIDSEKGTKATILLNSLAPWEYIASLVLCGKVTTNGTTCKYRMTIENIASVPGAVTTPSTFVASDLCLPPNEGTSPIVLDIRFSAFSQLINQTITPVTNAAGVVVPVLNGSLMLNTKADIQVLQNTKVCFNAMI